MGSVLEEASMKYFYPTLSIWCIWEERRTEMKLIGETITESVVDCWQVQNLFCSTQYPYRSWASSKPQSYVWKEDCLGGNAVLVSSWSLPSL
jgi:hypothetical protein